MRYISAMIYRIITMMYSLILFLDPQNATDDFVFLQEDDRTASSKLVAINVDIENIPYGLVLIQESYVTNAIELLNESIF